MKLKKTSALLGLMAIVFVCASYTVYKTSGAHPGSTGAPNDLTCAQLGCHTDAQVVLNPIGTNTLIFSSQDSSYVPGQTYSITINVEKTGVTKFGFEIQAIKDADSTNAGQFIITDAARTQIITHLVGTSDNRSSITHKTAGTPAQQPGATQWTMNWQAPPSSEGNITFYYATNCTNNNNSNTGDKIFLSSFTIKPKVTSVKELADVHDLKLYFNPETGELEVSYDLKGTKTTALKIIDAAGKPVFEGPTQKLSGKQQQKIKLGQSYSKGTYVAQLLINDQAATKKIIVY